MLWKMWWNYIRWFLNKYKKKFEVYKSAKTRKEKHKVNVWAVNSRIERSDI